MCGSLTSAACLRARGLHRRLPTLEVMRPAVARSMLFRIHTAEPSRPCAWMPCAAADVIKVERPVVGDDTRGWGPPFVLDDDGKRTESAYFLAANRGKRSLAVDMSTAQGQEVIKAIAAKSDLLIENFKVGACCTVASRLDR